MEMLDLIHEEHQGISKCLLHFRESLFWPGISNEICQTVDKCGICQATSTAQRKLPGVPSEIPPHAWHTIGTDLFYWKHFDFLVLRDYSKFLIVRKLPCSTSSTLCREISNIFTEFSKPYIIRSDNGPCYASKEFKELMELFQVQHFTSSPHFPQSNGFAEAMVKIAKKLMDGSTLQEKPWNFTLMEYRCTLIMGNIPSPLEFLTGQKPRTGLPSIPCGNSTTREYHEALIKKQQMDISEELSISTYEPGQTVWGFDTLNKIWRDVIILLVFRELLYTDLFVSLLTSVPTSTFPCNFFSPELSYPYMILPIPIPNH